MLKINRISHAIQLALEASADAKCEILEVIVDNTQLRMIVSILSHWNVAVLVYTKL